MRARVGSTFTSAAGPVRAIHYGGADYVAKANDEIVVMGMVETKEGLANLDAICATPGLDCVYIGPADLSFALGLPPRGDNPDPVHIATCDKIRDAAHKHGKKAAMHCASAAFAAGSAKRGFDLVMLCSDLASMVAGVRKPAKASFIYGRFSSGRESPRGRRGGSRPLAHRGRG